MVEIYNYDITTHDRFAKDQQDIEAFRKQYHLPPTGAPTVTIQTKVLDFVPKHPAVTLLMQTYQRKLWPLFKMPANFYLQRFASSYVAPSLGSQEKQDADIQRLEAYLNQKTRGAYRKRQREEEEGREEEEEEKPKGEEEELIEEGEKIIVLLEKGVKETNSMVDYIIARMHQFVQA